MIVLTEGIIRVAVIGAGQMGTGIAQVVAVAGYETVLMDVDCPRVEEALAQIGYHLARAVEKGKMEASFREEILSRISRGTTLREIAKGTDFVIEAIIEDLELKRSVFKELDEACPPGVILATNTSGLSITAISAPARSPERVIGTHFFYPAPVMRLVEVICGAATSDSVYERTMRFVESLGKVPVRAPDTPGFLVNRLITPLINEAAFLVMEGADPRDVDRAAKLGLNFPMGPLELADFVGLDVQNKTMEGLYAGFCDSKYKPCPLVKSMVEAGRLGRKSGQGFYEHTENR